MATFVTIVNRVLRRLREDTVANYDDTAYSTLVGDFVNETINEMQGRADWVALIDRFTIATDGTSLVYALTSAESENSRDSTDEIGIRRIYNDSDDYDIVKIPYGRITANKLYTTNPDNLWGYREVGLDTSDRRKIELYPDVASKSIVVEAYNPHGEITVGTTQVLLPARVVWLGAYARAVDERGEDAGTAASSAWGLYTTALSDAIVAEIGRNPDLENDWRPE